MNKQPIGAEPEKCPTCGSSTHAGIGQGICEPTGFAPQQPQGFPTTAYTADGKPYPQGETTGSYTFSADNRPEWLKVPKLVVVTRPRWYKPWGPVTVEVFIDFDEKQLNWTIRQGKPNPENEVKK